MSHAILALGSNLGDREATLRAGVAGIAAIDGVAVDAASRIVETPALKPEGVDPDAPAYLNAVVAVTTTLDPHELLSALNEVERSLGRVRDTRWGDRTLDIDIITFDALTVDTDRLTIPHPRAADRAFVLAPWLDVEPDATLPARGRIADLLAQTGESPTPFAAEPLAPTFGMNQL